MLNNCFWLSSWLLLGVREVVVTAILVDVDELGLEVIEQGQLSVEHVVAEQLDL